MKIFYSEFVKDYSTYTFSYAPYAVLEENDNFSEIYSQGFLPYTGNIELKNYIYYMARSIRLPLVDFQPGSENRRVLRKFEDISFDKTITPIADFNKSDPGFLSMCTHYGAERFKGGAMAEERLSYILHSPQITHVITYFHEGQPIGYILACIDDNMMHYWFSFFTLTQFTDLPLGKYLMLDSMLEAQSMQKKYFYIGTCYGNHSLYKVRDFKGMEFSEGGHWTQDVKELKRRCKADDEAISIDQFKQNDNDQANQFLDHLVHK